VTVPDGLDRIELRGLEVYGHHGVLPEERRDGQPFVLDVTLGLDLQPAADADDLTLTVDYGTLAQQVHDAVATDPVDLIETVADRVVGLCMAVPSVRWVSVTVHKPRAPIAVTFSDVSVTIERSKQ